jgi:hypothetical protein
MSAVIDPDAPAFEVLNCSIFEVTLDDDRA